MCLLATGNDSIGRLVCVHLGEIGARAETGEDRKREEERMGRRRVVRRRSVRGGGEETEDEGRREAQKETEESGEVHRIKYMKHYIANQQC